MNAEQQKSENHSGHGRTGGTREGAAAPPQTFTALDPQRALTDQLMEQIGDPKNLVRAYRRVRANKGKPGGDGMTVHELADWLRQNHAALTASLLDGTYQPQPVRGVQIPKPGGGQRQLGIPVAVDRLVQQAILQVLNPILDPTFSNKSRAGSATNASSASSGASCRPGMMQDGVCVARDEGTPQRWSALPLAGKPFC